MDDAEGTADYISSGGASGDTADSASKTTTQDEPIAPTPARRHRSVHGLVHRPHLRPIRMNVQVHTLDSLRYRNYQLVWATTASASGAFWLYQVVIGWLTYDLTRSPLLTSLAQGLDHLPFLVLGLFAGVLVDALDRRKIIAVLSAYQAAVIVAFAAIVIWGQVQPWHIFVFVMAMGVSWPIIEPARAAMIPNIVPRRSLVNAIALNSLAFSLTRVALPAAAGALIVSLGTGRTMLLGAAMFLGASLAAQLMRAGQLEGRQTRSRPSLAHIVEAARYVRGEPLVLTLLLLGVVPVMLAMPFTAGLMPVYASEVFHMGAGGLGFMVSALGAGAIVGTLALATKGEVESKGHVLVVSLSLVIVSMTVLAFSRSMVTAVPALVTYGAALMVYFMVVSATIQTMVPDRLRGRVIALSAMSFGLIPIGSLMAGSIAELFGAPTATLVGAGALSVALLTVLVRFSFVWRLKLATEPGLEAASP